MGNHRVLCGRKHNPLAFRSAHCKLTRRAFRRPSFLVLAAKTQQAKSGEPLYTPTSARNAIETADAKLKQEKDATEAIRLYKLALEMQPNEEETTAALYNLGCAYTKTKQWQLAVDSIVSAVNDHNLKIIVPLKVRHMQQICCLPPDSCQQLRWYALASAN